MFGYFHPERRKKWIQSLRFFKLFDDISVPRYGLHHLAVLVTFTQEPHRYHYLHRKDQRRDQHDIVRSHNKTRLPIYQLQFTEDICQRVDQSSSVLVGGNFTYVHDRYVSIQYVQ